MAADCERPSTRASVLMFALSAVETVAVMEKAPAERLGA